MKGNTIDRISPEQALEILRRLARIDPKIKKKIENEAEEVLKEVEVEDICEEVYSALDGIDVEELWDRAGPSRYGYSGPEDMAAGSKGVKSALDSYYSFEYSEPLSRPLRIEYAHAWKRDALK